jgi:uncharacterized spore protein YtfJ
MGATEMLQKMGDSLGATANVKSVFGDPIQVNGKTVVPIATVAYGFGAGGGTSRGKGDESGANAEGGGGGGGVRAFPAGALEITTDGTRFIPFHDRRWLACAFAAGALIGSLLLRKSR